jgi:uncharacterized peroxidase-related enzyme
MTYLQTTAPDAADGDVRAMYDRQQQKFGYVPNYARVFCHRPELMALWAALLSGIRRNVDARRFELVTLSAAHALRNSYCSLAHAKALAALGAGDAVRPAIDPQAAGDLPAADAAIAAYARKVASDASRVSADDIAALKSHGLTDAEIFDIAATAAARAFFAKLLDALGVQADAALADVAASLGAELVAGRPIEPCTA